MKPAFKASRHQRRPSLEPLEARTLLSGSASGPANPSLPDSADRVFVRFGPSASSADRRADLSSIGGTILASYPDGPELIRLGPGVTVPAAVARLRADPGVAYATPDSTIHAESLPFYPNDPAFNQLWGLNNPNNVDVDAPEAYGVTVGSASTIVAVIDTGIDLSNPDFAGKIWTNPGNDAAQGYANDVHGWNFINGTNNVQDDDGHGTHVSSIIAGLGNNSYGVAGVAPGVQVMPLKFLDANGNGSTDAAVSAIYFAVNHGARVINASWGGLDYYGPMADAIAYANAHNVVFVTAAGNDGTNNDLVPSYPASFRQPNEISVAAVDRNGALASFSNYGGATVDLAAPGVDIVGDVPASLVAGGLESLSGTSMATAYVSGVAALVAGLYPTLTAAQVVHRIDFSVKVLPSLVGKTISAGIVDAYNAVTTGVATFYNAGPPAGIPALVPGATTEADLHAVVLASDEFFAANGSSAVGFITGLYVSAFGRVPDLAGLQNFVGIYNSGMVTRYQLARAFLTLPEGRQAEVARWYQVDLNRTASLEALKADPFVGAWANLLVRGVGDRTVEASILASPEFLANHGSSPVPVVQGYFVDLTGRGGTATELAGWSNFLVQGVTPYNVVRVFQSMPEVSQTLVAVWFITDLRRPQGVAQLKADPGLDSMAAYLSNA